MRVNYRDKDRKDGKPVRVYRCRKSAHLSRVADWCDEMISETMIARLSKPDAVDLLVDSNLPDLDDLRQKMLVLTVRLDQLAADFADGEIEHSEWKIARERIKTQLAELEDRMQHVDRSPVLADLVTAPDVRAKWESLGLDQQRAVINLLCTVTLLRRGPGRYETPPETVEIVWK